MLQGELEVQKKESSKHGITPPTRISEKEGESENPFFFFYQISNIYIYIICISNKKIDLFSIFKASQTPPQQG